MNPFQIMPCNDNLIFAWVFDPEDNQVCIRKRSGILVERLSDVDDNDASEEKYKTVYIDEDGEVCEYDHNHIWLKEVYYSLCRAGETFVPKNFGKVIDYHSKDGNSILRLLEEIKEKGGMVAKTVGSPVIKVFVNCLGDSLVFVTWHDFFSFGNNVHVRNPFAEKKGNDSNIIGDISVRFVAQMLKDYRKFYVMPELKVRTTFINHIYDRKPDWMSQEEYDIKVDEMNRHEKEWVSVLDLMINEDLSFEEAKIRIGK